MSDANRPLRLFSDRHTQTVRVANNARVALMVAPNIEFFHQALEYICAHDQVWKTTGAEIADYYYANYYQKP